MCSMGLIVDNPGDSGDGIGRQTSIIVFRTRIWVEGSWRFDVVFVSPNPGTRGRCKVSPELDCLALSYTVDRIVIRSPVSVRIARSHHFHATSGMFLSRMQTLRISLSQSLSGF